MGVKKEKKKEVKKEVPKKMASVWQCLSCNRKTIGEEAPTTCPCHNGIFAINKTYEVL